MENPQSEMLEVVKLANGRYAVQAVGETVPEDEAGEFETLAEAEDWMFQRTQELDARDSDMDVLKPGQGQGL